MSDDKLLCIYADYLSPQLRPKYFVAIEERIYQTAGDSEPLVDLQSLLAGIYDRGSYDLLIDYSQDTVLLMI